MLLMAGFFRAPLLFLPPTKVAPLVMMHGLTFPSSPLTASTTVYLIFSLPEKKMYSAINRKGMSGSQIHGNGRLLNA